MERSIAVTLLGLAGAASGQLIEDHTLSFPTLLGIAGIVIPATWWLSRKFTAIDDTMTAFHSRFKSMEEQIKELRKKINGLPCEDYRCRLPVDDIDSKS